MKPDHYSIVYKEAHYPVTAYSEKQAKLKAFMKFIKGKHMKFAEINRLRKEFVKKSFVMSVTKGY